jgi:hypothetical protein
LGALHARLDRGGQAAGRPPVPADDLETARVELRRAESLWSKAQAAFATGNLPEAVTTATAARATLDGVAGNWPQSAR